MNSTFYHWGSLVVPLGYGDPHLNKQSGNPYGAGFTGGSSDRPGDVELTAARIQGDRLARFAAAVAAA